VDAPNFWEAVIEAASSNRRARIILENSTCVSITRQDPRTTLARIRVTPEVLAACRSSLAEIEAIASQTAGHRVQIDPVADAPAVIEPATPRSNINEHPLVKSAMELFKARLLSVQPRQPAEK
jgi:hypothetical protein